MRKRGRGEEASEQKKAERGKENRKGGSSLTHAPGQEGKRSPPKKHGRPALSIGNERIGQELPCRRGGGGKTLHSEKAPSAPV